MSGGLKGDEQPTQIRTFPILNKLNYQVWASHMHLYLEGLNYGTPSNPRMSRKKDRQVMSILFITISNKVTRELGIEKTAKKTWNTLKVKSKGVT